MALFGKKGKTGAVGETSRFRTFGIFLGILILVLGGMYYAYQKRSKEGITSAAALSGSSRVKAVGATETISPEFSKLVREKNIQQAEQAERTGKSAVATVVRPSYFDSDEYQGRQVKKGCSVKELRRAREAGVSASELRCLGCPSAALKSAGFTAAEMRAAGFSAQELRAAGFTAVELKTAGFSASDLKSAGLDVSNLAEAGYTAAELSQAGFTPDQLRFAGFSDSDLAAAGIGVSAPSNLLQDRSTASIIKARQAGVSAAQLRKLGIGAAALKAAGYTAQQLKAAGFTATELKAAGFEPTELKAAGYTAAELVSAGFTPKQMKDAGYSAAQLREAGVTAVELAAAGYTAEELRRAGFSDGDLFRGGIEEPKKVAEAAAPKCDVQTLRSLRAKGIAATAMVALGCNTEELTSAGFTEDEITGKVGPVVQVAPAAEPDDDFVSTAGMSQEDALLAQIRARQEKQLSQQDRKDQINRRAQVMRGNANALMNNWVPPAKQQFEVAEVPKDEPSEEGAAEGQQAAGTSNARVPTSTMAPTFTVKAGTIMFGVLDTGVNSDEQSPVLATIVEGKFKGSRLVGSFQLLDKRLLISFNKLGVKWHATSVGIKVVAIDPDTARTALASNVDNHYFLRYGTLFASSFLSGLSTAITSSGSQTSSGAGGIVTTTDPLSTTEKLMVALGEVGTQYASVLGDNFTKKPTVTVEAGQGVGLLFTDDAVIPLPSLDQAGSFRNQYMGQSAGIANQQVGPSIARTLPDNQQ